MTPLWVPLVVAAAGLVGTLGGVWLTQRRADRREEVAWNRERERERERWEREDERERARWEREDAARTFDHRRDAYTEFYESLRDMAFAAYNHGMGLRDEEELGEWQLPTYQKLQHLHVYATPAVAEAAGDAYSAAWHWGANTAFGRDDAAFYERQDQYDSTEDELLARVRADLSIPDGLVGPGGRSSS
jgi:hypothetical protein